MTDHPNSEPSPADLRLQSFNERALSRIFRTMLVVSAILLVPAFWRYGWLGAVGFAAGATISCINFRALQRTVEALAHRIVTLDSQEKGAQILLPFLLRYGLVGAVAYAIFMGS